MLQNMNPLNPFAVFFDKHGARRLAEEIWLKLKNSRNNTTSSLAYQALGERYLKDSRCADALRLYQESMSKLKDAPGDGRQCYAATLVFASSAAMSLNDHELAHRYLNEVLELDEIEDWILDSARKKLLVIPKHEEQQEGTQSGPRD